jgi:glycosyltransferase involved in cell wall biosynthesis
VRVDTSGGVAMKVALDVSAVPAQIAGAGRYIAEIARRLPEAGVSETLVSRRHDARWEEIAPVATHAALVPASRPLRLAYEALLLGRSSLTREIDVWHSPHYTMPRRRRRPTVVTIHDMTFFSHPEWHEASKVRFFQHSIRYAARHADALICVSETTRRELLATLDVTAPIIVAPHGVDHDRFSAEGLRDDELLASAGLSLTQPFLFFVGTLEPRKGIDVLLSAFAMVRRDVPDLELWVAGQAGWGDVAIGAQPGVRQLGYVPDELLPALLRRAQAVVYPSRGEGFGLPVLEALACGARVVTSAQTVMEEVAGEAAAYAAVGEADDLAAVVSRVLAESAATRAQTRATGLARAATFTWDRSLHAHLEAYSRALA